MTDNLTDEDKKYIERTAENIKYNDNQFDTILITLIGVSISLEIAVIKMIMSDAVIYIWCVAFSLWSFFIGLLCVLVSFKLASREGRQSIAIVQSTYGYTKSCIEFKLKKTSQMLKMSNFLGAFCYIAGLFFFITFATANLYHGNHLCQTKRKRLQSTDHVTPTKYQSVMITK